MSYREAVAESLRELDLAINATWRLGQYMVVGWSHEGQTVHLCVVPTQRVFEASVTVPQVFQGQRHMASEPFLNLCKDLQARPTKIVVPLPIGDGREELPPAVIDNLIRRYSVTRTGFRAVMLFDIVGFSRASSIEQVAQLNSLEYSINGATKKLRQIGIEAELARSTVGDGFYVWNRSTGLQADISTYISLILILADNARALREGQKGFVPVLRACFTIGPHYSYHQVEGTSPRGFEYIVGEVTITLARLISKTLSSQVLIGAFRRPLDNVPGREVDTPMFMTQAAAAMAKLSGLEVGDFPLTELRSYLTGAELKEGRYGVEGFKIEDKHGYLHECFNANVVMVDEMGTRTELGVKRSELDKFEAEKFRYDLSAEQMVKMFAQMREAAPAGS
ncbi:MAG: hypothetical protein FJX54_02405 [Alphaproteobacteria bacterium]|nr:hypothetical protein [Alphaproteobacteria bacterium]